jgi:magnesium-protoporphyrin O-methyltransferase
VTHARAHAVAPAADLRGLRVLDAGCGTGLMTAELAARGAEVVAVDISPQLVEIARTRLPEDASRPARDVPAGDMLAEDLGRFDHVLAMDSLIYYARGRYRRDAGRLSARTRGEGRVHRGPAHAVPDGHVAWAGKLFPRADRSPPWCRMPKPTSQLPVARRGCRGGCGRASRVSRGFYISDCLELRRDRARPRSSI